MKKTRIIQLLIGAALFGSVVHADPALAKVSMEMVRVGNPGNPGDVTGYGSVWQEFAIGKHEVTIAQYTEFLNAVAKTDTHGLWQPLMEENPNIRGIERQGSPGGYVYTVMDNQGNSGNRPVLFISWFSAARFTNWMSNGQPSGAQDATTTEDGAYTLEGRVRGTAPGRNLINPNTGDVPRYSLPTENEWYKAAYYSPLLANGAGGYYRYATRSNTLPDNKLGDEPNQANFFDGTYAVTQSPSYDLNQNYLTEVGTFTRSYSYYGTFDQNGNVFEWNDLDGQAGLTRGMRGGNYLTLSQASDLESTSRIVYDPASASNAAGFRLASPAPLMDMAMLPVGYPRNDSDPATGHHFGRVQRPFRIGEFEITIGQYTEFLNAVATTDTHGLYHPLMENDPNIAGIHRKGESGNYHYSVMWNQDDSRLRPITYVSWFDAARFANWLSNGQPSGPQTELTTENGAYALRGRVNGLAPRRNAINPNTRTAPWYFLPTENEWYKAAYYDPTLQAGRGGYWAYATRSNVYPGNLVGNEPNQINYVNDNGLFSVTQQRQYSSSLNYLTSVGSYRGSPSYFGTFDQNGNVYEWNDLDGRNGILRGLRGGCWYSGATPAQDMSPLNFIANPPDYEANVIGIRLAGPPNSLAIAGYSGATEAGQAWLIKGRGVGLDGQMVTAWVKSPGDMDFKAAGKVRVDADGAFTWTRRASPGKTIVYFTRGKVNSNRVTFRNP